MLFEQIKSDNLYVIFGRLDCVASWLSKNVFEKNGLNYVYFNLDSTEASSSEYLSISSTDYLKLLDVTKEAVGRDLIQTVPQIYIVDSHKENIKVVKDVIKCVEDKKFVYIGGYKDLKDFIKSSKESSSPTKDKEKTIIVEKSVVNEKEITK